MFFNLLIWRGKSSSKLNVDVFQKVGFCLEILSRLKIFKNNFLYKNWWYLRRRLKCVYFCVSSKGVEILSEHESARFLSAGFMCPQWPSKTFENRSDDIVLLFAITYTILDLGPARKSPPYLNYYWRIPLHCNWKPPNPDAWC